MNASFRSGAITVTAFAFLQRIALDHNTPSYYPAKDDSLVFIVTSAASDLKPPAKRILGYSLDRPSIVTLGP